MQKFVWVILIIMAIESVLKIICLATDNLPPRSKGGTAFDIIFSAALIMWGVVLLNENP